MNVTFKYWRIKMHQHLESVYNQCFKISTYGVRKDTFKVQDKEIDFTVSTKKKKKKFIDMISTM